MAISIRFYKANNTYYTIPDNMVMGLSYKADLFDGSFKLGATVCQHFTIHINKDAFTGLTLSDYTRVDLYDGNALIARTYIDSISDEDDLYYEFLLIDKMVNLNAEYDWSSLSNPTVTNILNAICTNLLGYSISEPPTRYDQYLGGLYGADMVVTWDSGISARDFVSYVAEINGAYAFLNQYGYLKFRRYKNAPTSTIQLVSCKDFKLGERHYIDRVVHELGTATTKYPPDSSYSGTGNTVYVNPNNILITDSQSYTRDAIIQQIYSYINQYEFYSLKTSRCQFSGSIRAGDLLSFADGTNSYPTIAQIDWQYNTQWYGGFELKIDTKKQEETQVSGMSEKLNQISIKVDRELNAITQTVSSLETNVSDLGDEVSDLSTDLSTNYYTKTQVEQTASDITISALSGYVSDSDLQTELSDYTPTNNLVSYINLNSSQIVLSSPTLIFGNYPNGAYVEMLTGQYDPSTGSGFNGIKLSGHSSNNRGAITWIDSSYFYYTGDRSEISMFDEQFHIYGYSDIAVTSNTTKDVYHNIYTKTTWNTTDPSSPERWTDWTFWQSIDSPLSHSAGEPYIVFSTRNELIVGTPTITQSLSIYKANISNSTLQSTILYGETSSYGQIKTSFNSSVAMGSYQASATTIANLVDEVRYSSGVMGSANISASYTNGNVTIPSGWYNFIYSPHRSGGVNGTATGDNCNYGSLLLMSMTADNGMFKIRVSSGAIGSVRRIGLLTAGEEQDYVTETGATGSWAYRKWASGKTEAWRTVTVTASATTKVGSVYRSSGTVDLPSGLFSSAPHLVATMDATGTNLFQAQAHATSATNIDVRVWRANASTATYGVDMSFYAWRG